MAIMYYKFLMSTNVHKCTLLRIVLQYTALQRGKDQVQVILYDKNPIHWNVWKFQTGKEKLHTTADL